MTTENTAAEAATTPEDRFFGIKTSIDDMRADAAKDAPKEEEFIVETVEEGEGGIVETEAVATPQEPAKKEPAKKEPIKEEGASDEDVEEYGAKVQKRIDKLTWEKGEETRRADAAEQLKTDAISYAQTVNQQNQQQAEIIANGEAYLIEQVKGRAALAVDAATNKYRQAHEEGSTDALVTAQAELMTAQAEQTESLREEQAYKQRVHNWTVAQQAQQARQTQAQNYQQQQQQQPAQEEQPTREAQSWTSKNTWFWNPKHGDMTAVALSEHERLIREDKVIADSDEYYEGLDAKMRSIFPGYFTDKGTGTVERPSTVVAPGNRNNGGKPRTVRLEPRQVALAKELNITPEQLARQILKESQ
jgi:hypothetical protein